MAEPVDIILPMLKEMRSETASLGSRTDERFDKNDHDHKSFKNALSAHTLRGRLLTGECEERIKKLETKVSALESRS